jgi:hypothetical protein
MGQQCEKRQRANNLQRRAGQHGKASQSGGEAGRRAVVHAQNDEGIRVGPTEEGEGEPVRRDVVDIVQVLLIGLCVRRLVLGDGVDEGVAGAGVLDEETADAGSEGPAILGQ